MGKPAFFSAAVVLSVFLLSACAVSITSGGASMAAHAYSSSSPGSMPVSAGINGNATPISAFNGQMNVLVTFGLRNQPLLNSTLASIYDPASPQFHHFLTRGQFADMFSSPPSFYDKAASYFSSFKGIKVRKYQDRMSISLEGSSASIGEVFGTRISTVSYSGNVGFQAISPSLPSWISSKTLFVSGLSNLSKAGLPLGGGSADSPAATGSVQIAQGYPVPITSGTTQYIWGSDLQKAYNVSGILNASQPVHEVIATLLWANTAPYYPCDVQAYFNQTLPSWEPKPNVTAVPVNGAPLPGPAAANDTTDAAFENTLDIEMAGSLAPGAHIFNVYGPDNTTSSLDEAFAEVLNPSNATSQLNHVSVVSNSWYAKDHTNPTWTQMVKEASARGITVLACSGDSGNNPSSPKDVGSDASYPGTVAFNSYGMTSVGGTSIMLSLKAGIPSFLSMISDRVWYSPANVENNNGPVGTQGGISSVYGEPQWQKSSGADAILKGQGRGVPDIAAIANNTLIFRTVGTKEYYDNPDFYYAWGTSISAPVIAGIVADINAVLGMKNRTSLGFLDPILYGLSNLQYPAANGSTLREANYTNAFYDITNGSNYRFTALKGYDLVTGLGSLNAGALASDIAGNVTSDANYVPSPEFPYFQTIAGIIIVGASIAAIALSFRKRKRSNEYTPDQEPGDENF